MPSADLRDAADNPHLPSLSPTLLPASPWAGVDGSPDQVTLTLITVPSKALLTMPS